MSAYLSGPAHRQFHLIDIGLIIKFLLLSAQLNAPQIGEPCILRILNIGRFDVAVVRIDGGIDQELILQDFQRAQVVGSKNKLPFCFFL